MTPTAGIRDLIAAVLVAHQDESDTGPDCTCGWVWHGETLWRKSYADHLAGVLIRDVLTPEFLADLVIAAVQKAADNGVNP